MQNGLYMLNAEIYMLWRRLLPLVKGEAKSLCVKSIVIIFLNFSINP